MNKYKVLAFALMAFWQILAPLSTRAQFTKTKYGITVNAGGQNVQLCVGKASAFRLSIGAVESSTAIPSVFIDESINTYATFTVVSAAPSYGIETSYGRLMLNTSTNTWSLYDSAGNALISNGTWSTTSTVQQFTYPATGTMYGSGNTATKALIKNHSYSAMGNGVADIPYVWNNQGYSMLGINSVDTYPASWQPAGTTGVNWRFHGDRADLYMWPAKTLYDAAAGYIGLTGKPKIPPRWAFGYLQSKWGWGDANYIKDVATKFRTHKLPVDVFIIDFEWYTTTPDYSVGKDGQAGFTDFTFNPSLFPSPAADIATGVQNGIKFIGIRKPRLGNNVLVDSARKNGWLIKPNTDSRDLDFSQPALRTWYGGKMRPLLNAGTAAWWNDEGESYYTCYYWWNTAENDLLASARPNYRHFTLNRAFSPGCQRFGYSTWSGDIVSTWESLANVPHDLLNYSLAGMYYGTCDIGGFSGTPTTEMLVRWFQAGVFLPIMRSHSGLFIQPRFPYLWGDAGEAAMRKALNMRYQLLPYTYSLAHEAYNTGAPIMRPLVMEFPDDTTVANMADEWLLGKGILAAPVLNAGGTRTVYLPKDTWYNPYNNNVVVGPKTISVVKALDEIPVYIRAGSIIPFGPVIQYSEQTSATPLEIHIYPGKNGSFNMFEDDGTSYNYTAGTTRVTSYVWDDKSKMLTWVVSGNYTGNNVYKTIKAVLGNQSKPATLGESGKLVFADNASPVTVADSYTVPSGGTLTASAKNGVLQNDNDEDGNPLKAIVVDKPAYGNLTLNTDGSFTYTNTKDTTADSFTYKTNEGFASGNINTVNISITPAPGAGPIKDDNSFTIYPNPATTSANVRYTLPSASAVTINIYNKNGLLLRSFKTSPQQAGINESEFETGQLKTGFYVVKVIGNNYSKIGKLVIR